MGKLIIVLALSMISGCSIEVDMRLFKWAEESCKNNGGIKNIKVSDAFVPEARCNNGAIFNGFAEDIQTANNTQAQ